MYDATTTVLLLAAILVIYMLPTLIAFSREHRARAAILVLNIAFGWTLVVWLILFLWAALARVETEQFA